MKKILLGDNFDFRQKAVFLTLMSFPLLTIFGLFYNYEHLKNPDRLIQNSILAITCLITSLVLFITAFSKKGLLSKENKLYLIYTFLGKNIYCKIVNLENKITFTTLRRKVNQKNSYLSAGGADISYIYFEYDVIISGMNGSDKVVLITVKTDEHANSAETFLNNVTNLKQH